MDTTTATPDTGSDLDRLQRQVTELVDRDQIATLVHRLARCLDEARFAEMHQLFTEDATAKTPGGVVEGRRALVAQAGRNHTARDHIQHLFGNVLVDVEGDQAAVHANAVITFTRGDEPSAPDLTLGERYQLGARRTPDGWRLSRVATTLMWSIGARPVVPADAD